MQKHYLHLSAYPCDECAGPVVAGWLAMRENEISKETGIRQVGAICLACGRRQSQPAEAERARHLLPMEWNPVRAIGSDHRGTGQTSDRQTSDRRSTTFAETLNRAEVH